MQHWDVGAETAAVEVVVKTEFQVTVVSVAGSVPTTASAHDAADHIIGSTPGEGPVVVDLSRVKVGPDELAWIVLRLEAVSTWHRFRLVDDRLDQRRALRRLCRRVPVLPDVSTAVAAARSEVPPDTEVVDVVALWGHHEDRDVVGPAPDTSSSTPNRPGQTR
ncbi:MAG: hypothetical protein IPG97_07405 [Microthrixaceae bacterium]|nr:hypothetical protein [Microthrixaceae bacterium]